MLVVVAIVSVQFGATLAVLLIPAIGVGGTVALRLTIAAVLLAAFARPRLRGHSPAAVATVIGFGLVIGGMNFSFYSTLSHLPIGVAVTLEFLGPLALAAALSRRLLDGLAVLCAALGVLLCSRVFEVPLADLQWRGLAFGLLTAAFWAGYILLSARTGAAFPALDGLAIAMVIGALVVLPFGVHSVGSWSAAILAQGAGIAILSSILPYSLELVALRRLSAKAFGVLMSLEPAIGGVAGLLVLGQRLSGQQVLGMGLVVLASLLILGVGARATARPSPAPGP